MNSKPTPKFSGYTTYIFRKPQTPGHLGKLFDGVRCDWPLSPLHQIDIIGAMWTAIISAIAAIVGSAAAIFLTKLKERQAEWRSKKLSYYEEFFAAASGIVGDTSPPETKVRFATAVNNLHLIASHGVIVALHDFLDEIAVSNQERSQIRHDALWSILVWQIREDIDDPPTKSPERFKARLWASGIAGRNP